MKNKVGCGDLDLYLKGQEGFDIAKKCISWDKNLFELTSINLDGIRTVYIFPPITQTRQSLAKFLSLLEGVLLFFVIDCDFLVEILSNLRDKEVRLLKTVIYTQKTCSDSQETQRRNLKAVALNL